jgi:hypothetical protein
MRDKEVFEDVFIKLGLLTNYYKRGVVRHYQSSHPQG